MDHDAVMRSADVHGSAVRRRAGAVAASVTVAAFAVFLAAHLALVSVLDPARADRAASEIAASRLTTQLIDSTVRGAVGGVLDPSLTSEVVDAAAADPTVRDLVRRSLVTSHRQLVDPDGVSLPAAGPAVADADIDAAIGRVLDRVGVERGVDLSGVLPGIDITGVAPEQLPGVGLGPLTERARLVAAVIAVVAAAAALAVTPLTGQALVTIGRGATVVSGVWVLALFGVSRLLEFVASTLLGEVLATIWRDAVPTMIALCVACTVLAAGTWMGGVSMRGYATARRERAAARSARLAGRHPGYPTS